MSGDPGRFIVLLPMTEARGLQDVTSVLRARAQALEERMAAGTATHDDAAAFEAVKRVLGEETAPPGATNGSTSRAAEPPMLLRFREVALLLGLSESNVRGMASRGELPTVRIGSAVRVRRSILAEWIAALPPGSWGVRSE